MAAFEETHTETMASAKKATMAAFVKMTIAEDGQTVPKAAIEEGHMAAFEKQQQY